MSAGGRALAQSIGQFGQNIGQMGETIYKVEADNEFRNQSLLIADGIEKFNTSLLTDPDYGTPGMNEGYMKKWEDYKRSIDTQIQQVKNPLAKKNLEGYVAQVSTKQHSSIYALQYEGWSEKMVADGQLRINNLLSQSGLSAQQKMGMVVEELDSLQAKNLLKPGKRSEIQSSYLKQIASDELIKTTQSIMSQKGAAAAREYILTAGFEAYKIGDEFVSVDTGDIDKALSYVRIRGTDLGDKEYTSTLDKVISGELSESDYTTFLASENASDSQKSAVIKEWYSRKGETDATEAIIGMGNFVRMSNGETNIGKITTWADIESLARSKKIDTGTLTYLQGQYNLAKNNLKKLYDDQGWVSVMLDIVDGKVSTVGEAIKRGASLGKSEEARVLFLQTTSKNTADATIKANNDATDTIAGLEKKMIAKSATWDDFETASASITANKDILGEAYPTVTAKLQSLGWKIQDQTSEGRRATLEQKIRTDPTSVTDDEIWGKDVSPADSSFLSSLKLQAMDRATLTDQEKAIMDVADKYSVNEKVKRGEALKEGETPFTRKDLEGMKAKLSPAAYVKYSELLDRDEAESAGMKEYWDYYNGIEAGTTTTESVQKDKKLSFPMKADLLNRIATKSGNDEQKKVSTMALNLVRTLNGEDVGGAKVLSFTDLATIKDPQAHQMAVNALAQSVEYLKKKGKSERYLFEYKKIVEGKVDSGLSILENKSLEPDEAIELYSNFITFTRQKKEEERGDVQWARQTENWIESQKNKEGYAVIVSIQDQILDGTYDPAKVDALALTDEQKIQVKTLIKNNAERLKEKTQQEIREETARKVNAEYERARRTAMGKLKDGENPLSIEDFQAQLDGYDTTSLPESVKRFYTDRSNELDEKTAADTLSRKIREAGSLWVQNAAVDPNAEQKLSAMIESAPLADKDWARAMVQTYKSNAQAVARQKTDDEWVQTQRRRSAEEQTAEDARKSLAEGRKVAASRTLDQFKAKLKAGMTEEEYLGFQAEYIEIFKDAPEEFSSAFRLADVLYAGVTDTEYAKKESILSSAFNELVSVNTIEGYKATGDKLSIDLINKTFPSDSKTDVKGREYWMEKFQNFQKSDQANKIAKTNAKTLLAEARTRSWDVVTGVAPYDPEAVYLDENLIKKQYPYLSAEDRDSFHNDLTQLARATEAKAEADRRAAAGTAATANEKAVGNAAYTILEGIANILEYQTKTTAAPPRQVTYTNKAGKTITKTVTPELYNEIKKEFADDLILSGDWGKAEGLALKFVGNVKDPIWTPIYDEITKLEKEKKPISVETRAYIDQVMAANHNPDAKTIESIRNQVRNDTIKINLSKTFDLSENRPDVSEEYLSGVYSGKWQIFMNAEGTSSMPIHKGFTEVLNQWASKTLSTVNLASNGKFIEGRNISKEVFGNGHVQYKVNDKAAIREAGFAGDEAVFYLGFYEKDALPIVEIKTGKNTTVKAWIPWETKKGSNVNGRWVIVESYKTSDGTVRYRKTQEQMNLDKISPSVYKAPDSISAVQNYPAFGG